MFVSVIKRTSQGAEALSQMPRYKQEGGTYHFLHAFNGRCFPVGKTFAFEKGRFRKLQRKMTNQDK